MKKLIILTLFLVGFSLNLYADSKFVEVTVDGLICEFCVESIRKLSETKKYVGVIKSIDVNLNKKVVKIYFEEGQNLTNNQIIELIKHSGYSAKEISR